MTNKLTITLLFTLLLTIIKVKAQDESIFNRINGVKLTENIYLKWDDSKKIFRYASDDINSWHDVDEDLIFKVKNDHKNNFKVFIEFYNPLRYSIKSETKDIDDPAYQAISEFFSKLPTLPNSQTVADNKTAPAGFSITNKNTNITIELNQSIILHEWIYQFNQALDTNLVKANIDKYQDLVKSINELGVADDYLFGKLKTIIIASVPESSKGLSLNEWIKNRSNILFEIDNDFDKFKTEHTISVEVKNELIKSKGNAENSLKVIITLLSSQYDDRISKFIKKERIDDFKKYSNSTSVWLSMNHIDRFDANKKTIEKFETYLTKLDEHIKKFKVKVCDKNTACNYYTEDYDIKLSWKSQKMKSFKYEVKKLDKEGADIAKSNTTGEFIVGKRLGLYPFVSSGIVYTGFSYPNYSISTNNGINTVGKAPDTKVYVRPALFLNFLITSWDPVYPFFQIGITTGVNDAIFPVGFGFTIGKSFSISGGPMIGYRKDLGSLNVGDPVKDETALKNDLVYKGFVSGYFSINYNFGKK